MKKNMLRIAALVVAAVLMLSCFAGCGSGDSDEARVFRTYKDIKKSGKIRIGVSSDNNPMSFVDESGEYRGFEASFAKRLAEELKVKPVYVSVENDSRIKNLENGKVDVVIAGFADDKNAGKYVDFALPYMKTALGAVCSDKNKVKSLDKLNKKDRVIVISGSPAAYYMTQKYPKTALSECVDENEAIYALNINKGVIWLDSNTETASYAEENDGYSLAIKEVGNAQKIAPAVSKGNKTLLKKINKAVEKLEDENFFSLDYADTLVTSYGEDFEKTLLVSEQ